MNEQIAKIIKAGGSVIIREFDHGHMIGVAVQIDGLRHGVPCTTIEEGVQQIFDWFENYQFYKGAQWTAADLERLAG